MDNIEIVKASLKKHATAMRTRITKYHTFLSKNQFDREALEAKIKNVTENYQIFKKSFAELSPQMVDEESQARVLNEEIDIEDNYTEIIAQTNRILKKLIEPSRMIENNIENNTEHNIEQMNSHFNIRLPEINLPTFDGSYENWPTFRDQFSTRIDKNSKLTEIDKFQYLQSSVTNRAAKLIDGITMTRENYKEAWKILQQKYDDSRRIISRHWEILFNLPPFIKNTPQATGDFVDSLRQHIRALKNLGSHIDDGMIIYLICSKLNQNIVYSWELTLEDKKVPSFDSLLNFLEKRSSCAMSYAQQNITPQKSNATNHKKQVFQLNSGDSSYKLVCHICKGEHKIYIHVKNSYQWMLILDEHGLQN